MADQFRLEVDGLAQVVNGLRDVESQLTAKGSRLRGQLGAGGAPWQFPGGPSGVETSLENTQQSVESTAGAAGDLADSLQTIVNVFSASDAG